jgi:hypothetical protein
MPHHAHQTEDSMNFEHIREELQRLNCVRSQLVCAETMRKTMPPDPPKITVRLLSGINPEHLTWTDLAHEVTALEEQIVETTGFGIEHWVHPTLGEEMSTYVLIPKNPGWLKARKNHREADSSSC